MTQPASWPVSGREAGRISRDPYSGQTGVAVVVLDRAGLPAGRISVERALRVLLGKARPLWADMACAGRGKPSPGAGEPGLLSRAELRAVRR